MNAPTMLEEAVDVSGLLDQEAQAMLGELAAAAEMQDVAALSAWADEADARMVEFFDQMERA